MLFFLYLCLKELYSYIEEFIPISDVGKLENMSVFEISQDYNYSKLLLISDFHLGKHFYPNKSISLLSKQIYKLYCFEKASMILILGDSIDSSYSEQLELHYFLAQNIDNISSSIFIIGGNHDREIVKNISSNQSYSNQFQHIKYIANPIILLDTNVKKYFFAHDLLYNYKIRGKSIPSFIHYLKKKSIFSNFFETNDSLIIGHTHEQYANEERGEYCIGQFSIDSLKFDYAILETSPNHTCIQLKHWKYEK